MQVVERDQHGESRSCRSSSSTHFSAGFPNRACCLTNSRTDRTLLYFLDLRANERAFGIRNPKRTSQTHRRWYSNLHAEFKTNATAVLAFAELPARPADIFDDGFERRREGGKRREKLEPCPWPFSGVRGTPQILSDRSQSMVPRTAHATSTTHEDETDTMVESAIPPMRIHVGGFPRRPDIGNPPSRLPNAVMVQGSRGIHLISELDTLVPMLWHIEPPMKT